ncbi:MAG: SDR family NAD(P)-dependent oxidoreductase [Thermoguttaceae bacterium]|jgi:NAD(P)-dependent dehydrogenase (short-subunit alcohol dehydrogenase family)
MNVEKIIDFTGRRALVTGAAGAIGRAIATGLAANGARVFLTDLNPGALEAAVAAIPVGKDRACGLAADVADESQVRELVAAAKTALGGQIDILVNVAGIVAQGKVEEIAVGQWDQVFAVNCRGTFLLTKHVVPLMKAARYGKIINFSSKSGKTGSALMSHYSAAKAAVIGFTQALAYELADWGITVNCLCPGITEDTGVWNTVSAGYIQNLGKSRDEVVKQFTSKVPLKRLAHINDIVALTLFLAGNGADYMTGQAINVTGGREMH